MKSYLYYSICVSAVLVIPASPQFRQKRYRNDYEYNRKTDAFYKFHTNLADQLKAKSICEAEGAQLIVPDSPLDIAQVHEMLKRYPDLEYVWVSKDNNPHDSAEGDPIIDLTPEGDSEYRYVYSTVLTRAGEIATHLLLDKLPFVCKVEARSTYYDPTCQVYNRDYEFFSNMSSCYGFPRIAYTWNQAYEECEAEGAHLVVINSEAENELVWDITKRKPVVPSAKFGWYHFLGYRAPISKTGTSRVFRTIFNQTLEEAGFVHWGYTEPNNIGGKEYCVSMWQNDGTFNDINCMDELGFICEKPIAPK